MRLEFHNKKMRRHWSPARRAADAARRAKMREWWYRHIPPPDAAVDSPAYERLLLDYLASLEAAGEPWVALWPLLNELGGRGNVYVTRPRRQAALRLVQRLIRERRLVRHRKTNSIARASSTSLRGP
jgi:hypothetical protein